MAFSKQNLIEYMRNKNIAVIGLGISNMAVIRFLNKKGISVTACDEKTQDELEEKTDDLTKKGNKLKLGKEYLDNACDYDVLIKTPVISPNKPELIRAREKGTIIISEIELFFNLCKAPIIGITGSDGKTTTTSLIGEILKKDGHDVFVGGNIGTPLIDKINSISNNSYCVLELSSFQLQTLSYSPNVSVVLNVTPNHLDIHSSMEEYISSKKNIYLHQGHNDYGVFNLDNTITQKMAQEHKGHTLYFSMNEEVSEGAFIKGDEIILRRFGNDEVILNTSDIRLRGSHNIGNVLAAITACSALHFQPGSMKKAIAGFRGVEHRLEYVREIDGVKYYNDSIASTPARSIASMTSFDEPVVLIAGGYDKNMEYDDFADVVGDKVKALILIGNAANKIEHAVMKRIKGKEANLEIRRKGSMEEAVACASLMASAGEVVLLAPACASFDMFNNFAHRGVVFKKIVHEL